jgi:mRNA interferase MazF
MRRGEIWSVSGSGYSGKHRPAVVVQDHRFAETASITVCQLTSNETAASLFRVVIMPSPENGLRVESRLMVDKMTTTSRQSVGKRIGVLATDDLARLDRAMLTFLGLAGPDPTA